MWRTDSAVPEVAPAPSPSLSNPEPAPGLAPVLGQPGGSPGRFSATVSLTRLLQRKGKSGRLKGAVIAILAVGLIAGLVKVFVFPGGDPKPATAATEPAAPAPATQPAAPTRPAKSKTLTLGTAPPAAKPAGGSPAAAAGAATAPGSKPKAAAPVKFTKKPAVATSTRPQAGAVADGAKPSDAQAKAPAKTSATPKSVDANPALGPDHVDKTAGYAVRFPPGWTKQSLNGRGGWLAEAADGKSSSMAVGLGPDGGHGSADAENLAAMTKLFTARPDTIVEGAGFGTLAGRRCMWHKLSVPAPASATGTSGVRYTTVHYFAPLGDGRALKVRVVSRPETFAEMAPRMKQSLDTLRLLTPQPAAKQVASGQ